MITLICAHGTDLDSEVDTHTHTKMPFRPAAVPTHTDSPQAHCLFMELSIYPVIVLYGTYNKQDLYNHAPLVLSLSYNSI